RPHEDDNALEDSPSRPLASAPEPRPKSGGDPSTAAKPDAEVVTRTAKPSGDDKKSKLGSNLVFVVGFLLTLVLGYYVGQWVRVKFGDKPQPDSGDRYGVELRGDEPQLGPDDALVTIIEFADYQ